jgi:enoyl-[acyl-carrier protein] reductase II
MRDIRLRRLLAIDYPILQAGVPWVSNPELVAAVSDAGGLGVLHPSAGMAQDGDMIGNLRENIRATRRLTAAPFGVCFYLANPQVEELIDAALQEGARIAVTYGGSPALYTGKLKAEDATVLHQVSTVRHARGAEAQGVDVVVADGYEGGGIRGPEEIPNLVLAPQIAEAVSIPIVVSGGVMDARGYVAAMALGAHGVQLGTRFVATHECIAHPKYKEALLGAIDTGTIVAGRYHWPTRLLRSGKSIRSKNIEPPQDSDRQEFWDGELGATQIREAILDGNLESSVAYCGAGVGLVSEIVSAAEVVQNLASGSRSIIAGLR